MQEFNNRKYDAYVWVKVGLPLKHLARPIFKAVRDSNMKEIEAFIPLLEVVDSEIIGFAYRDYIDSWDEFKKETWYSTQVIRKRNYSTRRKITKLVRFVN